VVLINLSTSNNRKRRLINYRIDFMRIEEKKSKDNLYNLEKK